MDSTAVSTEKHHRIPRSLLTAHDRLRECAILDGEAIQLALDFEHTCFVHGLSLDLSREELAREIEASVVEVSYGEHRRTIHGADWPRWGRMGGLATLARYGPRWFSLLARRRWRKISPTQFQKEQLVTLASARTVPNTSSRGGRVA